MTQQMESIPDRLPRYRERVRQRGRGLLIALFVLIAVAGTAAGIFFASNAGDVTGAGLSLLYALIPLPALWLAYWWLDRYEPEPFRYKFAAFVWGGVVAVAIALALEIWIQSSWDLSDDTLVSVVAPVVEESAKAIFLVLTFVRARRVIDGVIDGLVLAGIVGMGFAFVENIGYYAASYLGSPDIPLEGASGAATTFVVRGVFSPFAHSLFLSAFGIALGLAASRRAKTHKVLLGIAGLVGSMLLHGLWNSSLAIGGAGFFLLVYLLLAGILLLVGTVAIVLRTRQVRILEQSLLYVAQRGWIHPAEIPYLSRFGYRRAARRYARERYGKSAAKVVARYQRLASEMAFLHHAVMSGRRKPRGVERTYALLDAMYELRPYLRFPPALQQGPPRW